ncbi:hypothetical protein EON65_34200 [archaeon]|nr:MAG: hypothetical protein EON65_34200 [archaeon]
MATQSSGSSLATLAVQNPLFREQAKKAAFEAVDQEENDNELWNQNAKTVDPSALDVDDGELAEIKKYSRYMRFAMIGISTLMVITAWYNISSASSLSKGFLALYVFFFSMLLCCFEIAIRRVAVIIVQNFGFMYNPVGKILFLVVVAILCYQLSTLGKVCFAFLLMYTVATMYIQCKHPKYGQYQRLMHYYNRARAIRQMSKNNAV